MPNKMIDAAMTTTEGGESISGPSKKRQGINYVVSRSQSRMQAKKCSKYVRFLLYVQDNLCVLSSVL